MHPVHRAPTIQDERPHMTPIRTIPPSHKAVDLPFAGSVIYVDRWPDANGERPIVQRLQRCLQRQNTLAAIALTKTDPMAARLFYVDRNKRPHLYVLRSPVIGHVVSSAAGGLALVVPDAAASRLAAELRFYSPIDVLPSEKVH